MSKVIRGILALLAIFLIVWNYFLRETLSIPVLGGLSKTTILIIAGVILIIIIIWNYSSNKYNRY